MESKPGAAAPDFTTGPWKPVECAVTRERAEEYVLALVRGALDPDANLMVVTQRSEDVTREGHIVVAVVGNGPTSQPNAALIAAAPELYAALERLRDRILYIGDPELYPSELDAADAALAKARGDAA